MTEQEYHNFDLFDSISLTWFMGLNESRRLGFLGYKIILPHPYMMFWWARYNLVADRILHNRCQVHTMILESSVLPIFSSGISDMTTSVCVPYGHTVTVDYSKAINRSCNDPYGGFIWMLSRMMHSWKWCDSESHVLPIFSQGRIKLICVSNIPC